MLGHNYVSGIIDVWFFPQLTSAGEPFLIHDSGQGDSQRIIVFATAKNFKLLQESEEWFVDGTFGVCPEIFHQLYTIHARLPNGKSVPAVYSLLPSKSSATYRRLLRVVAGNLDEHYPSVVHVDFELAMIRELEGVFPDVGIQGCLFHFCQCVWRHIQANSELREPYMKDDDFALELRMFTALAFVPLRDVRTSFKSLLQSDFVRTNQDVLRSFLNYFETTWIGRPRVPPRIKLEWWNVYEPTLRGLGRTNNVVEAWHSAFSGRLGITNPRVCQLIEYLQLEQARAEFIVTNTLAQGNNLPKAKVVYRDRQKRLQELAATYDRSKLMTYLKSAAYSIQF